MTTKYNPLVRKGFDKVGLTETAGDTRYLKLDQTTPQTIANGIPVLTGLTPTIDYQIATKKYVDEHSGGVSAHSDLTELDYASSGHTGFEPTKGDDDNYVTDAEKTVLGNTSGENTGDQDLSDLLSKDTLFSLSADIPCAVGNQAFLQINWAGTIESIVITGYDSTGASVSGSVVLDVWKDTDANYPPTVADTITASAKPTISSGYKSTDSILTGWTKTFSAGDWFVFNVDSFTTFAKVRIQLLYRRT